MSLFQKEPCFPGMKVQAYISFISLFPGTKDIVGSAIQLIINVRI